MVNSVYSLLNAGHSSLFQLGQELPPKQRVFLIRLLIVKGDGTPEIGTTRHLEQLLGVQRHVVAKVLNGYLFPIGVLKKVRGHGANSPFISSGRPTVLYSWDESGVSQWLRGINEQPREHHFDLTRAVLRYGPWGAEATLLLAVLLSQADALGVVRELPFKAFRVFAGFKRDQLKKTLHSLSELGFLKQIVPGGTVPTIFGAVASTYQVDIDKVLKALGKSDLGKGIAEIHFHRVSDALTYLKKVEKYSKILSENRSSFAEALRSDGVIVLSTAFPQLRVSPNCILSFFGPSFRWPGSVGLAICKIEGYASHILSKFWLELENRTSFDAAIETLVKDFFWDVVPKSRRPEVEKSDDLRAEFCEVAQFLLCLAWKVAVGVKQRLDLTAKTRPGWEDVASQQSVFASVIPEEGGGSGRSYVSLGYPK